MEELTLKDVLFFDTETTGVPPKNAKWDLDYKDYPHVVQLAWSFRGNHHSYIILPEGWEIPDEAAEIHGITTERAVMDGDLFDHVIIRFLADCIDAKLICAHNIHFDTSVIKANIVGNLGWDWFRMNDVESALFKGKRIDTMRPSMKWVDARTADGRLKFPKLEELFARCFPGQTFPAHDALEDVIAVEKCLPILVEKGICKLAVKEYPDETNAVTEQKTKPAPEPAKQSTEPSVKPNVDAGALELLNANDF